MVLRIILILSASVILLACANGSAETTQPTMDGRAIYETKCTLCHGADGKLQLAGASDLSKSILSLEEVMNVISNGRNTMAPYKDLLSKEDIKGLAEYIETFRTP